MHEISRAEMTYLLVVVVNRSNHRHPKIVDRVTIKLLVVEFEGLPKVVPHIGALGVQGSHLLLSPQSVTGKLVRVLRVVQDTEQTLGSRRCSSGRNNTLS